PGPGVSLDIDRLSATRRGTLTTSACGVCGRRSVDDVIARCAPLPVARGAIAPAAILAAVEELRSRQPNFARTGGIHGAAIHDAHGNVLAAFEDIGRHNAVDKVVGALLLSGRIPGPDPALLVVSGRASYEVVQKTSAATAPVIGGVSGASWLTGDSARSTRRTGCGRARRRQGTWSSHPELHC